MEDGRLTEAEAVLRTAAAAADTACVRVKAATALSRCLYWMGRLDEALVALDGAGTDGRAEAPGITALRSRILVAEGLISAAVRAARRAVESVADQPDLRIRAEAWRALAIAVAAAGDDRAAAGHINDALKAASAAHVPLVAARLRLTLADIQGHERPADMRRLVSRVIARQYPRLLQAFARAVRLASTGSNSMRARKRSWRRAGP